MSPFAVTWIGVDLAALVLGAALFARRDKRTAFQLRPLLFAQVIVIVAAIVAASTPPELRSYAEWTLMVAVNSGYALRSWTGGPAAHSLATMAIVATAVAIALILLKSSASVIVIAIGLVLAVGALFAALLQRSHARARA